MRALPIGLVILAILPQRPKGIWYWRVSALGALNIGLFFPFLFIAAYGLPGAVIATTNATQPFVVATLAWAFLGEQLTMRLIAAACAGIVGIGLIFLSPAARLDLVGVIAALAATIVWACGTVLTRHWRQPAPLLVFSMSGPDVHHVRPPSWPHLSIMEHRQFAREHKPGIRNLPAASMTCAPDGAFAVAYQKTRPRLIGSIPKRWPGPRFQSPYENRVSEA
jgi:hypothetical protein